MNRYIKQFSNRKILPPDDEVMSVLCGFHWPGNIRQLQNAIKKQCVINDWPQVIDELSHGITPGDVVQEKKALPTPEKIEISAVSDSVRPAPFPFVLSEIFNGTDTGNEEISLKDIRKIVVQRVEKEVISYVLEQTGWNRMKASKILKISYKTMLTKITELGLLPPP